MAAYKHSEDIVSIGAYTRGSNPKLDKAIAFKDEIDNILKQSVEENISFDQSIASLRELCARIK